MRTRRRQRATTAAAALLLLGRAAVPLPARTARAFPQQQQRQRQQPRQARIRSNDSGSSWRHRGGAKQDVSTSSALFGIVKPYIHQGYRCSYRYCPGSLPPESDSASDRPQQQPLSSSAAPQPPPQPPPPPIVLLHPIGIGLSSWYYKQLINYWNGPSALYAPDLLGCGLENGNAEWNPAAEVPRREDGSTTLAYVEAVETLMREVILGGGGGDGGSSQQTAQSQAQAAQAPTACVLVAQGGLAPVAIELAARNPTAVSHLVLITPPTWEEITSPLPLRQRFQRYKAYTSPVSYTVYDALETALGCRAAMSQYFKRRVDDQFVSYATEPERTTKAARGPVASFNSGALFDRSYEAELRALVQPALILVGDADARRNKGREGYLRNVPGAVLAVVDGGAALPWESPVETRDVLRRFVEEHAAAVGPAAGEEEGDGGGGGGGCGSGSGSPSHPNSAAAAAVAVEGGEYLDDGDFVWGSYGEESSGGAILSEIERQQREERDAGGGGGGGGREEEVALRLPEPRTYQHGGRTLTYRHKPAEPGQSYFFPTLLLVHGIGVGQSSWFWEQIFQRYPGEIIAPDLIGCGLENGGDPWDPTRHNNLQIPIGWVRGIERLMQNKGFNQMHRCVVVTQNNVAPIGIKLATRNENAVSHLVLLSPPCWERLTTEFTTEEERQRRHMDNIGPAADFYYTYLESKVGYRLKMREFFENPPDDRYINIATAKERTTKEARNPIIATNAGDLFHRSFEEDLKRLQQPMLIIAGSADKVVKDKRPGFGLAPYSTKMSNEKTVIVDGKVMLPWESPDEVMKELRTFLDVPSQENDAVVKNVFTTADNLQ